MAHNSPPKAKQLFSTRNFKEAYQMCRVVCGPTRFKIIVLLNKNKSGLSVTELARALNSSVSRISHQLHILKKNEVVEFKKVNREVIYKLADHRVQKRLSALFG